MEWEGSWGSTTPSGRWEGDTSSRVIPLARYTYLLLCTVIAHTPAHNPKETHWPHTKDVKVERGLAGKRVEIVRGEKITRMMGNGRNTACTHTENVITIHWCAWSICANETFKTVCSPSPCTREPALCLLMLRVYGMVFCTFITCSSFRNLRHLENVDSRPHQRQLRD